MQNTTGAQDTTIGHAEDNATVISDLIDIIRDLDDQLTKANDELVDWRRKSGHDYPSDLESELDKLRDSGYVSPL